jgi:hypothetical protein
MGAGNSVKTPKPKGKPRGRPFQPGQSGNLSGRRPLPEEFRSTCRQHAEAHLPRLISEIEAGGQHWVKAWELLAAYGFGKPTQPIAGEDGGPVQIAATVVILPGKGT